MRPGNPEEGGYHPILGMKTLVWHYDAGPLFSLKDIVDAVDWISEVYVYGGYARALLGYPPFTGREEFTQGHDIDICFYVDRHKAKEFVSQMRRKGIKLAKYLVVPPDETEDEYWEDIIRWIEEGVTPQLLASYLKEQHGKVGSHSLSWMTGDLHKIEVEGPTPTILIKPQPIIMRHIEGSNPAESDGSIVPYWVVQAVFTTFLILLPIAGWVASQLEQQ